MGSYNQNILPASTGLALGSASQKWAAYLANLNATTVGGVAYADQYSGVDMGAQINAAYAALPSTGGTIYVAAGSYTCATPIVLQTLNKPVLLLGSPGSTFLDYSGAGNITAITLGWGNNASNPLQGKPGSGIDGLMLKGGGGTSIGLEMNDGVNGVSKAVIGRCEIRGFGTNIDFAATSSSLASYLCTFDHCEIQAATSQNVAMSAVAENIRFENCVFGDSVGYAILINSTASVDIGFDNCSFDYNTSGAFNIIAAAFFKCVIYQPHFEAHTGSGTSAQFINCASSSACFSVFGGIFVDAGSSGTNPQMINLSAGSFDAYGCSLITSGTTTTQFVNCGTAANCILSQMRPIANISALVNTSSNGIIVVTGPQTPSVTSGPGIHMAVSSGNLGQVYADTLLRLLFNSKGITIDSSGNVIVTNGNQTIASGGLTITSGSETISAGDLTVTLGDVTATNFISTAVAPTVSAGQLGIGATTATSANTGANGDVPAQVVGYLIINVAGTARKVPFYAT